ncbi:Lrp/AsnC family transcriptional regulator [Hydrogenoanaerobacterium sp.]|uniref:Lrp/AsnC family transcriptional regulator n=1 Tax=Hydrogenoanaerobacterium sp. TaxID=2953763 RepID=UPI00289D8636|nr:Lrp/AsnC family transcriptional regulator [Hydrogenoanaerobacterium sp.]
MDKLLKLLEDNARMSNAQLAVMLDTSEENVAAAIAQYEKEGVIHGYTTLIDWEKTGRDLVMARIEIKVSPKKDRGFEEIAETIMEFDEVETVYLMSGGYDLALTVKGKTFKDVAMFVAHKLSPLDSVLSTATHFVLRKYKERGFQVIGEERDERSVTLL